MFDEMTRAITEDTVRLLMHIQVEEKLKESRWLRLQALIKTKDLL